MKKEPIDRLMDEARIQGARMFPNDMDPDLITEEDRDKVISRVKAIRDRRPITVQYIARQINSRTSVVSQVLNKNYTGRWRPIILNLDRWLASELKRESEPAGVPAFIWTRVAEEIDGVANTAVVMRAITAVYGPDTSGFGKTMALREIADQRPGSIFVTIEEMCRGAGTVLDAIIRAMPRSKIPMHGTGDQKLQAIISELHNTDRLLIIDDIQNMCGTRSDSGFFVLVNIWNAAKSPQIWSGTADIIRYLEARDRNSLRPLSQIRRRILMNRDLTERARTGDGGMGEPIFTADEMQKLFAKNKIRLASDAIQYLARLANIPGTGAIGTCVGIVQLATLVAKADVTLLTEAMLRSTQRGLRDMKTQQMVEDDISEMRMAKVG